MPSEPSTRQLKKSKPPGTCSPQDVQARFVEKIPIYEPNFQPESDGDILFEVKGSLSSQAPKGPSAIR